jgi:hypothetical protein
MSTSSSLLTVFLLVCLLFVMVPNQRKTLNKSLPRTPEITLPQLPTGEISKSAGLDVQQILDSLPEGRITFNPPEKMFVGKQERLEVRISQDLQADLARDLVGTGTARTELIPVSQSMKISLLGKPYFNVESLNSEEQLITTKGFTQWSWDVTPLETGEHPLHLSVRVVIRLQDGSEKTKDYPVKDTFVLVKITPRTWISRFLRNDWHWIAGTLLLPLAAFVVKKIRKRMKTRSNRKRVKHV